MLEAALGQGWAGVEHHAQPAAVSLTQVTEAGTVYRRDETAAIAEICRANGLGLHVDGARFANALSTLGCQPGGSDLARRGWTSCPLVRPRMVRLLPKRFFSFARDWRRDSVSVANARGHLVSKMRFVSAQLDAYLADGLWLANASHANAMAARLSDGLRDMAAVRFLYPVEANELFVTLPARVRDGLAAEGFAFYPWQAGGPDCVRLVTAFDTPVAAVDTFIACARRHAGNA